MSTKVVINESPQYKLSIANGADQTLSVTNGIELQVTANVGGQGPAGPNEIIQDATITELEGFIYGYGGVIDGAVPSQNFTPSNYGELDLKLPQYDGIGSLYVEDRVNFGVAERSGGLVFPTGILDNSAFNWTLPDASGTIALSDAPQTFTGAFEISNSSVKLSQIPTFSDNAAASSLAAGSVYKTSTGELRIKY